jgi:hypothetical protein
LILRLYEVTLVESVNRPELQVEADTLPNDNDTVINADHLSVEVEIDAPTEHDKLLVLMDRDLQRILTMITN